MVHWLQVIGPAALLTMAGATGAQAQSATPVPEHMPPAPCDPAQSPLMTISQISAAGAAMFGRCVTVEAIALGMRLYADNGALYASPSDPLEPTSSGVMLGLYGRDRGADPAVVRVRGRIDSCERLSDVVAASGGIAFFSGYCHYHRGTIIQGQSVEEVRPFRFVRRSAADTPVGYRRIVPLEAGEVRMRMIEAARPYFEALRRNDRATITSLIAQSDNQQADLISPLLDHPAVVAWRQQTGPEQIEIFGWVPHPNASAEEQARWGADMEDGPQAMACLAPADFAARNLWPVDAMDTSIVEGRPYICTQVWLRTARPPAYLVNLADWGTAEPAP